MPSLHRFLALLALALTPVAAAAQAPADSAPASAISVAAGTPTVSSAAQPTAALPELFYQREQFVYPLGGRIDPVSPPAFLDAGGLEVQLSLRGVVFDQSKPAESAAVLQVGGGQGGARERQVVRVGDKVGRFVVIGMRKNIVYLEASRFGAVRRFALTREDGLVILP